jgi:hypothetical protein
MFYPILRGLLFHIIVGNFHAPAEDKIDNMKGSFCEELECVVDKILK